MTRARVRELGITIGDMSPGPLNAITDVPGVRVGHTTVIRDDPVVRTGVTMITARDDRIWEDYAFCAWHRFNGNGELTGIPWIEESGLLGSPIGLTNTNQVGLVRDALVRHAAEAGYRDPFHLPVVTETYDGWLSDIDAFALTEQDAFDALAGAASGPVAEGNVGGGTGMLCHEFKGGIGTSSRIVDTEIGSYTVGVLVQANYGERRHLRFDGMPVGRWIGVDKVPAAGDDDTDGSIIVVIATDAPLIPIQCSRLAQRATVGVARVGSNGRNGSGELFLAFATGNSIHTGTSDLHRLEMVPHPQMNPFFEATADATEEAILNALCAAETMTGYKGRTAYAIPLDPIREMAARR
jgi:D-aminopeptidase